MEKVKLSRAQIIELVTDDLVTIPSVVSKLYEDEAKSIKSLADASEVLDLKKVHWGNEANTLLNEDTGKKMFSNQDQRDGFVKEQMFKSSEHTSYRKVRNELGVTQAMLKGYVEKLKSARAITSLFSNTSE